MLGCVTESQLRYEERREEHELKLNAEPHNDDGEPFFFFFVLFDNNLRIHPLRAPGPDLFVLVG